MLPSHLFVKNVTILDNVSKGKCILLYYNKSFVKSYRDKKTITIMVAVDIQLDKFHLTLLNLFHLNYIRYIQIM